MTDRWIPEAVAGLRPFVAAGVLGQTEVQVVATFAHAVAPDVLADDVLLAAALAVRGPLHGHVCVDLAQVAGSVVAADVPAPIDDGVEPDRDTDDDPFTVDLPAVGAAVGADGSPVDPSAGPEVSGLAWPDPEGWAARLAGSPLARWEGDEPGDRLEPLVVRGDVVYLDRHWRDEVAVADALRTRASLGVADDPGARAAVDRLFPEGADGPDAQRRAALAALEHRLVVVAGGPGTGKTRTVARLLAVLESAAAGRDAPLEVALAAPTGKAAARLTQAIAREVQDTELPPGVAERLLALEARTVHRLLGVRPGGVRFRHDSSDPLTADVVVVDEVSMVSLPLMARLLDAVRPDARVVLVGDPHQLASVEAGAVLGDLVGTGGRPTPAGVSGNIVVLDRVHRFGEGSAIASLAAAINGGDADAVVDLLRHGRAGTAGAVRWFTPDDADARAGKLADLVAHAATLVDLARHGDAAGALDSVGRLKVLCATRRGPDGAEAWNRSVEADLRRRGRMRTRWSAGRPVMVTANDYLNGVFNGDVGVVVRPPGARRAQVAFGEPAAPRLLDPALLDRVETQWAMTIHKSQGSEFDHVVVTLPPPPSPILTRELLYTAVTRARRGVTVVASEGAVRAAVARPVTRSSGLADRLG